MIINDLVTDYMATNLITFNPDTDIQGAIQTIVKNQISGAPVLSHDGELVGIISEKDCIRLVVNGPYNNIPNDKGVVGDYMSTNVRVVSHRSSIGEIAYKFSHSPYRRFPVVDDNGKLVGQISRRDILRAIIKHKPTINHVPSSWGQRAPKVNPSKSSYYSKNS